jgi:hypothetical protein
MGLGFGLMAALLLYPTLGLRGAMGAGGLVGAVLFAGLGYTVWRSVYGSSQGIVSSLGLTVLVGVLGAGITSALAVMSGQPQAALWLLGGSVALTLFAWVMSANRQVRVLVQEEQRNAWVREAVDLKRGWVREALPADTKPWAGFWSSPWMIGALSVNILALLRVAGWTDLGVMLILAPAMNAMAAWTGWAVSGPLLARALYLRRLERQSGITFAHPKLGEIQALRARWFFTRWLMPKRPT